jgi:hypothetical protein
MPHMKLATQVAVILMIFSGTLTGQDTVYIYHNTMPSLNTHKFVPQPLIQGPFMNSAFEMRMGVEGTVDLTLPLPDFLPDSIKGPQGNLLFVNIGFRYNQKIKDWISFYLKTTISVRSGTELGTLLFEGVNTMIGGETGVKFTLLDRPKHNLAGHVAISNYNATIINLGQFIRDVIDRNPDASLTQVVPALSVGIGASYAFGITNVMGLTANTEVQYGESITRGKETLRYRMGMALDFNWVDKGVPIGLSVAYLLRTTADFVYVDNEVGHSFAVKITYTAAPNFVLGVEITSSILPVFSIPEKVTSTGVMFNINYYFN